MDRRRRKKKTYLEREQDCTRKTEREKPRESMIKTERARDGKLDQAREIGRARESNIKQRIKREGCIKQQIVIESNTNQKEEVD